MKGLDDGPDGLNEDAWSAAWERAEREDALRRIRLRATKLPARRPTDPRIVTEAPATTMVGALRDARRGGKP